MNIAAWQAQLPTIATILTFAGAVLAVGRKVWPWARKVSHLIDDFMGEPARPGVPHRPGIMERIANLDDRVANLDDRVANVEYQLSPNGGGSTRDELIHRLDELAAKVAALSPNRDT